MIMFDDKIKNAFDRISPTQSQKSKMSKVILSSDYNKKIHMIKYAKVLYPCAAMLLIALSIYAFNTIFPVEKNPYDNKSVVISNTISGNSKQDKDTDKSRTKDSANIDSEKSKEDSNDKINSYNKSTSDTNEVTFKTKETQEGVTNEQEPMIINDTINDTPAFDYYNSSDSVLLFNDYSMAGDNLNNSAEAQSKKMSGSGGGAAAFGGNTQKGSSDDSAEESDMVNKISFVENIDLPADFDKSNADTDKLSSDIKTIYRYSGANGRSVTVTVSSDTELYTNYLKDDHITKTVLLDSSVILFSGDGLYAGYFVKDGYLYEISSGSITEAEFEKIILSIIS